MLHLKPNHHACLEKVHRKLTKNIQLKLTYIILTITLLLMYLSLASMHPIFFFLTLHLDKKLRLSGASLNHNAVFF